MTNRVTNKMLQSTSERLGIQNPSAITKAEEFLRVLDSKPAVKALNETAKMVVCLDLAAALTGATFDKDTALKLSGLRKNLYQNNLNNFQKILNLDKHLTVSEICVQISCPQVRETAENILASYEKNNNKFKDITHPQYATAAVYAACSIRNVKIDKTALLALSRLKSKQWKELTDEFLKVTETMGLKKELRSKKETKVSQNRKIEEQTSQNAQLSCHKREEDEQIEDYEVWKRRILKEATTQVLNEIVN